MKGGGGVRNHQFVSKQAHMRFSSQSLAPKLAVQTISPDQLVRRLARDGQKETASHGGLGVSELPVVTCVSVFDHQFCSESGLQFAVVQALENPPISPF